MKKIITMALLVLLAGCIHRENLSGCIVESKDFTEESSHWYEPPPIVIDNVVYPQAGYEVNEPAQYWVVIYGNDADGGFSTRRVYLSKTEWENMSEGSEIDCNN